MMEGARDKRKTRRVKLEQPVPVTLGSLGGSVKYQLMTRSLSINGFFLDFPKPGRFPFNAASIMEIWLALDEGEPLFFNGKMTRMVFPGDSEAEFSGPGIAVRIVQIDKSQEEALRRFIDRNLGQVEQAPSSVA